MGRDKNIRREADNEAKVVLKNIRVSPQKLNLVAQMIRKENVSKAISILQFSKRRISKTVEKALRSAIANAENNHSLDIDKLFVKEAYVGKGLVMKRFHARARGRGAKIIKPFSHLTILLDCDPEIGLTRATKRAELDRFEQENINFHKKIREGFLTLAKQEPKRIKCIDTHNKTIQDIHHSIIETLKKDLT